MITYNDLIVPPLIRTDRIISAFENGIDQWKVDEYAEIMKEEMLSHEFPAILGYPSILTEDDIGKAFMDCYEVTEDHLGQLVWYVTDGHHRTLAAIKAELPHFPVELDYSCITSQQDLKQYANV